jgi:ABC-type bacteriocin/lantibiotic exporter with double-glycine peptidase domain
LGINPPTSGTVLISGMNPLDAYDIYPGAVAYVPQETALIDGTVLENIAAGYSAPEDFLKEVSVAINGAALGKFINDSDYGLNTYVGEKGASISGGQRQRIGIARALFTRPKLLILDEATSALDPETESMISSTLMDLRGKCTILAIAHRLSTIKNADRIIYLRDGKLVQIGDYAGLIREFPEFLDQVEFLDSPAKPQMES